MDSNLVNIANMFVVMPDGSLGRWGPSRGGNVEQSCRICESRSVTACDTGAGRPDNNRSVAAQSSSADECTPSFSKRLDEKTAPWRRTASEEGTNSGAEPAAPAITVAADAARPEFEKSNNPGLVYGDAKATGRPGQCTSRWTLTGLKSRVTSMLSSPIPTGSEQKSLIAQKCGLEGCLPKFMVGGDGGIPVDKESMVTKKRTQGEHLARAKVGGNGTIPFGRKLLVAHKFAQGEHLAGAKVGGNGTFSAGQKSLFDHKFGPKARLTKGTAGGDRPITGDEKSFVANKFGPEGRLVKEAVGGEKVIEADRKSAISDDKISLVSQFGSNRSGLVVEQPTSNKANTAQRQLQSAGSNVQNPSDSPQDGSRLVKVRVPGSFTPPEHSGHRNGSPSRKSADNLDFQQLTSVSDSQVRLSQQSSTEAQAARQTGSSLPTGPTSVGQQILESIQSSLQQGSRQIIIRLNPPELGEVSVKFQEQEDQITGLLEVSKLQTRYDIEQALPQIIRNLQDSGIQVRRFEVVVADQPEPETDRNQMLQDGSFQQHDSAEQGSPDSKPPNEWLTNTSTDSHQDNPEPQEMLITNNRINMLI